MERNRQAGSRFELIHELVERGAAWLLLGGISAFESGAGVAGVEAPAGVWVASLTPPQVPGIGEERGQPGGAARDAPKPPPPEGGGGDRGPNAHPGAPAPPP